MANCRVGDSVRVIHSDYPLNVPIGSTGVIEGQAVGGCYKVRISSVNNPTDGGGIGWSFWSWELVPISGTHSPCESKFKAELDELLSRIG